MGKQGSWAQPGGLLPNGLLPNAGPLIRVLDSERWLKAEERTAELIACIQPNQPSEKRRKAVADYVQRLIMECFPCQVFTFGSVPLKTYLPDGDIDLTSFSDNQTLKDSWPNQVRDMLWKEEKNENAEFRVKEVQYIQAEVKLIKCMVENIVVDISFNQLGGLCTLCFLEKVDRWINQNHLFKRSIILIKAWCYYESRILGAHHGLISTYALETLVLYIFHVYNNTFTGPLEVLYRFLEFFSNFDWENFCVSLWGPVPISSLPDVTAKPPWKDSGKLLFSKFFFDACSSVYAVFPGGQENQGQTFLSKHFNVIDPLRVNNNLGRSVSKGNFFRIRSAFAFGAKRLARLLDCPKEDLFYAVNQFFMNTWDRHGSGNRPDAPGVDLEQLRLTPLDSLRGSEKLKNSSSSEKMIQNSSGCATVAEGNCPQRFPHLHNSYPMKVVSRSIHSQAQKGFVNSSSSVITDHRLRVTNPDKGQREVKSSPLLNDHHGRYLLARTGSSPELTHTFTTSSSRNRRYETSESEKTQTTSARHDVGRNNPSSIKHAPHNPSHDGSYDSDNNSNSGRHEFILGTMGEEYSSMSRMHEMHQDLVNLMASPTLQGHNGQVHLPNSLASGQVVSPSLIASMGQRNFGGVLPSNIPLIDPSFSNMKFPQGMMSHQLSHYFSGMVLMPNSEDAVEQGNENFSSGVSEHGLWPDHHAGCNGGLESDSRNLGTLQSSVKPQPGSRLWSEFSLDGSDSGQNLDSCEGPNHAGELNSSSSRETAYVSTTFVEHKPDILNSDFESHWKNLQFGRHCQNPYHGPSVFPPSAIVPPMYMQGRSQWDGSGRPVSSNTNLITQLIDGYGPHYLPMAPSQSMPNRSPNVYQRSFDEIPRHRIGTGTYFPNTKISPKDRHSSGNNGDYREGHSHGNSKSRGTGRNQQNRSQSVKLSSRGGRIGGSDSSRGDCPWNDWSLHQSQNGPQFSSSNQSGASDVGGYNMYTLPAMNQNVVVTSNSGSLMMLYSFDQNNSTYIMPPEHLEFGSLGPMSVSNLSEQTQQNEGIQRATRGHLDAQRFQGDSEQRSSPNQQPSPPNHNQRRL